MTFHQAFEHYANQVSFPLASRPKFFDELFKVGEDPRKAGRIAEKWFINVGNINWQDGHVYVTQWERGDGDVDELAKAFVNAIFGLYYHKELLIRSSRTTSFPFVKLGKGTARFPCPLHGEEEGTVFKRDDPYFSAKPLHEVIFCQCRLSAQRYVDRA